MQYDRLRIRENTLLNLWRRCRYLVKSFQPQVTSTAYMRNDLRLMKLLVWSTRCRHFESWTLSSSSRRSPARPWSTSSRSWLLTFYRANVTTQKLSSLFTKSRSRLDLGGAVDFERNRQCDVSVPLVLGPQGQGHDFWPFNRIKVTTLELDLDQWPATLVDLVALVTLFTRACFVHKVKVRALNLSTMSRSRLLNFDPFQW